MEKNKFRNKNKKKGKRNTSVKGKIRHLGNSSGGFCSFCRPKLSNRLCNKKNTMEYLHFILI